MSYQKQVEELHAAGALDLRPGAVSHVTVSHDANCPQLRGGLCNCEPDIRAGAPLPSGNSNRAARRAQKLRKSKS